MTEPPDDKWVKTTCKIGQGHDCCRYLTMSQEGWSCEKHTELGGVIDENVRLGMMVARSDNCEGRADRRARDTRLYSAASGAGLN